MIKSVPSHMSAASTAAYVVPPFASFSKSPSYYVKAFGSTLIHRSGGSGTGRPASRGEVAKRK
jgi:hypothetical protein